MKIEFKTAAAPTKNEERADDLDSHLEFMYGKENAVKVKGIIFPGGYKLVGYRARAPKKPWIVEKDGKQFISTNALIESTIRAAGIKSVFDRAGAIA